MRFGQRGVAIISPLCRIVAYIVTCFHPPYPVLPIIFTLAGFANGLEGMHLPRLSSPAALESFCCRLFTQWNFLADFTKMEGGMQ